MAAAPKSSDSSPKAQDKKIEAEDAATAQPTEDYTRAGGYMLTDRGWVLAPTEDPKDSDK